jgi:hypothetical protein
MQERCAKWKFCGNGCDISRISFCSKRWKPLISFEHDPSGLIASVIPDRPRGYHPHSASQAGQVLQLAYEARISVSGVLNGMEPHRYACSADSRSRSHLLFSPMEVERKRKEAGLVDDCHWTHVAISRHQRLYTISSSSVQGIRATEANEFLSSAMRRYTKWPNETGEQRNQDHLRDRASRYGMLPRLCTNMKGKSGSMGGYWIVREGPLSPARTVKHVYF